MAQADVVVIGGGVVGCAVARKMALEGAKVILLEKGADILEGASKGNSAILHTGFDAPVDTLEQECVALGYAKYHAIHKDMHLPVKKTGAILAAWSEEEEAKFTGILEKANLNGVKDLRMLSRKEVLNIEPALGNSLVSALLVPGESIIDPWSSPLAYLKQAVENGGQAIFNAQVTGGEFANGEWVLQTSQGKVGARYVVNCAGLYGDIVDAAVFGEADFTIKPRKGQFVVFDKSAGSLLTTIILPVPTERTKGIVLFPTIFGNVVVGPTAEEQESRNKAFVDRDVLQSLIKQAEYKLPGLSGMPVTSTFAGIRPATEKSPYRIRKRAECNWLTLGGIRSTGLTAALGLAEKSFEWLLEFGASFKAVQAPIIPVMPNLAEHLPRDYTKPGYDEIVCHCEMVTDREIKEAMSGSVPAGNLGGLKRRTRVTMGRCQGFYCSARLAELTKGKLEDSLEVGVAHD
ncbi:NAD(P)/FAD-dependent oxidoreductase [Desulfogranum japonicum]|uniref:NAD(P)/FAD-dependent oxidoreductase n=1 Tax=Desulfogranum japonicum TaxID=231447 RepID=UPI000551633F